MNKVQFTSDERRAMNSLSAQAAQLGINVDVEYLSYILADISRQKFTNIALTDYAPVSVGEGAWAPSYIKNLAIGSGDSFESGFISTGADATRLAEVKAQMGTMSFPIRVWAKKASWDIPSIKKSALAKYDIIAETEYQRKKNWDLGQQKIFFVGDTDQGLGGLLTNPNVTVNTDIIGSNQGFSGMDEADYQEAIGKIMTAYDMNSNYTATPNRFVIPAWDFTGMASAASSTFPMITKLEYMTNMFKQQTGRDDFRVLKCPYASKDFAGLNKSTWALYEADASALRYMIPVQYTSTLNNTFDGFYFQSVAYGEVSGMHIYYPNQVIYLQSTNPAY